MNCHTINPRTIAVRSLNETRLFHQPTYVASRYLFDSVAGDENSTWARSVITRKYPIQETPRFFNSMRFKKLQESGQPEYRQLLVPSPMTSLAEVIVMSALSTTESFQKPASVYSYLWPKSDDCPYNFEHYYKFYQKRNEDIAYVLRNNPRCLAIIADIEKFYPTIDHKLVQQRFEIRLVQGKLDLGVCNTARRLFSHLIAPFDNGKGIATGPDFGHVIGDLALCELDAELNKNLPGRYFRYVDDIIIVVEPDDKGRVLQLLHRLLEKEGLRTNGAKTDEVSSDEWLVHGPQPRRSVSEDSFEALRFRLKVFLALRPGRYESLQRALLDEGFFRLFREFSGRFSLG